MKKLALLRKTHGLLKISDFFVIGTLQKWVGNGFVGENGVIDGSFFEMVKNFGKCDMVKLGSSLNYQI